MKSSQLVAGVAIAAGVLLLAGPAFSQFDGRAIPGTSCYKLPGSLGTLSTWLGTVMNDSTADPLNVMCPIVTARKLTPGPEWNLYAAQVQVFDRHTGQDVQCTRYSEYVSGSNYFSDADPKNTTGSSSGVKTLTFAETDPIYTHNYVKCSLPPKQNGVSHILSVQYVSKGVE